MPRIRPGRGDRDPLLQAADDRSEDDEATTNAHTCVSGREDYLESTSEEDHVPSCFGSTMSLCGRSLLAVWHVSKMPIDMMLNYVWFGNAEGMNPTTPVVQDADMFGAAPTPSRPTLPRVDDQNSPLYKDFNPGKGYEAVAADGREASRSQHHHGAESVPITPAPDVPRVPQPPLPAVASPPIPKVEHSRIYTPLELMKRVRNIQSWLPLHSVVVEAATVDAASSSIPLSVTISGPLRRPTSVVPSSSLSAEAAVPTMSDLEDFILEDLSHEYRVRRINISDINFTSTHFEGDGGRLMSSPSALHLDDDVALGEEPYEVHRARVIGMIQNLMNSVVERRGDPWSLRLVFTRCIFAPHDLLDALRLPGSGYIEALAFERCPLADAHISSLLRRARQDDAIFAHLRSLRLCGTLSLDAVRAVLRYIDEEVEEPLLCELVVPASCVEVVGGHPLAMRLPSLVVNGKSIQRYQPVRSRVSSLAS